MILLQGFFFPLSVPVVLGHTALNNEKVDQTEWRAAKQDLLSNSNVIVQNSRGGRGQERVATRVSKSKGLLTSCFNMMIPPCTCHPVRFLSPIIWERVEGSFQDGVRSF